MKNYTTIENIEDYLLTDIDLSFQGKVEKWIETSENYIDKYTGRNFVAEEGTKLYDGNAKYEIMIDDCTEITSIEVDDSEIDDYKLYPANTTPKTSVYYSSGFASGNQNISIEGTWGYSETVPEDIAFATTVLVAGIINGQLKEGSVASEKIGQYQVSYRDDQQKDYEQAINILDFYKRRFI
jgi:hypothetical protein